MPFGITLTNESERQIRCGYSCGPADGTFLSLAPILCREKVAFTKRPVATRPRMHSRRARSLLSHRCTSEPPPASVACLWSDCLYSLLFVPALHQAKLAVRKSARAVEKRPRADCLADAFLHRARKTTNLASRASRMARRYAPGSPSCDRIWGGRTRPRAYPARRLRPRP